MKHQMKLAGTLGALGVAGLLACAPPPPPATISLPGPCSQVITRIYETNPIPCMPQAGQRLDVVMAVSNSNDPVLLSDATKRCNGWGGAMEWQTLITSGVAYQALVCRTTDPYRYGVWN